MLRAMHDGRRRRRVDGRPCSPETDGTMRGGRLCQGQDLVFGTQANDASIACGFCVRLPIDGGGAPLGEQDWRHYPCRSDESLDEVHGVLQCPRPRSLGSDPDEDDQSVGFGPARRNRFRLVFVAVNSDSRLPPFSPVHPIRRIPSASCLPAARRNPGTARLMDVSQEPAKTKNEV